MAGGCIMAASGFLRSFYLPGLNLGTRLFIHQAWQACWGFLLLFSHDPFLHFLLSFIAQRLSKSSNGSMKTGPVQEIRLFLKKCWNLHLTPQLQFSVYFFPLNWVNIYALHVHIFLIWLARCACLCFCKPLHTRCCSNGCLTHDITMVTSLILLQCHHL